MGDTPFSQQGNDILYKGSSESLCVRKRSNFHFLGLAANLKETERLIQHIHCMVKQQGTRRSIDVVGTKRSSASSPKAFPPTMHCKLDE